MAAIVLAGLLPPADAIAFDFHLFAKKNKTDPAERVPALILQLKTDPDEGKRQAAAEELKLYDPKSFPEMMQVLADALLKDASPAVRAEAAATIGKLRPVSQAAGYALEQAKANDASMRVRWAAQNSLLQYHLVGYRSGKHPENPPAAAAEPTTTQANRLPTAQPQPVAKSPRGSRNESSEPPLAGVTTPDEPRPLPPGQANPPRAPSPHGPTLTPVSTPKLLSPPATTVPPPPAPKAQPAPSTPPAQPPQAQAAGEGPALAPPE